MSAAEQQRRIVVLSLTGVAVLSLTGVAGMMRHRLGINTKGDWGGVHDLRRTNLGGVPVSSESAANMEGGVSAGCAEWHFRPWQAAGAGPPCVLAGVWGMVGFLRCSQKVAVRPAHSTTACYAHDVLLGGCMAAQGHAGHSSTLPVQKRACKTCMQRCGACAAVRKQQGHGLFRPSNSCRGFRRSSCCFLK